MTIDEIVSDFIRLYRGPAQREMTEFERLPSLCEAIRCAALCIHLPSGRRHPHQRQISKAALLEAERRLQAIADSLNGAPDFETLHRIIADEICPVHGIGNAVTTYDIAHRIGAFLGKTPRLVYLHNGTAEGARYLGFRGKTLDPARLPPPFSRLTPVEIEDCLCIYKHELKGVKSGCSPPPASECFPPVTACYPSAR